MGNSEAREENPFEVTSNTLYPTHIRILQDHFLKLNPTDGLVSQPPFMAFLDLPPALTPFGDRLFQYICSVNLNSNPPVTPKKKHHKEHHQSSKLFNFKQLVLGLEPIFRGHSAQQVAFLFDMYKKNDVIDHDEGRSMLRDIALISELNRVYYMEDTINTFNEEIKIYDNRIGAVLEAIALVYPFPLNSSQLVSWCCLNTPSLGKAFEYYIWHKFLRRIKDEPDPSEECLEFWPPYLLSSDISKIPECTSFIWLLACTLELNQSTWKTIFAASTHGRSLNRLCNQIVDYGGPTLVLILDGKGGIFGVYTSEEWRSKADFRADKTSFLFSLAPHFGVYRATGADSNNLYLYNNPNPHAQFPVGIGIGGIIRAFRLWINDDLEKGESREICTSYARGKISQSVIFEIRTIEVWGCGGERAEDIQKQAKVSKDKEIERRRKVKKELITETWDSGPSKFLMDMAGKTGSSDEFLDDVRKIRKMREDQKAEREKGLNKEF